MTIVHGTVPGRVWIRSGPGKPRGTLWTMTGTRISRRRCGYPATAITPARLPRNRNYAKSAETGFIAWRDGMADHGEVEYAAADGNDYPAHEQTYENFITLVKVTIAIVATIVILMAYFLT
jgi:Bacterial aa3 type cytochrome c oxidase subunit IV